MNNKENKENFNSICELFCQLVKTLEDGGYKNTASIVDSLMHVWLNLVLFK